MGPAGELKSKGKVRKKVGIVQFCPGDPHTELPATDTLGQSPLWWGCLLPMACVGRRSNLVGK